MLDLFERVFKFGEIRRDGKRSFANLCSVLREKSALSEIRISDSLEKRVKRGDSFRADDSVNN